MNTLHPLRALLSLLALLSTLASAAHADDNMTRITDRLDASKSLSFAYDPVGRMKRVTAASGDMQRTDYVFDGNGNRIKTLTRPLPTDLPTAAVTENYQVPFRANRLTEITGPNGTRSFVYDARGNLTAETRPGGITVSAAYDGYGRLTTYTRTGEADLTHVYNGMDERVASSSDTETRRFLYAPDGRVLGGAKGVAKQQYGANAQDVKAEFIWLSPQVGDAGQFGGDDGLGGYMPLAVAANDNQGVSQLSWVHASHMGVPIRCSDASGNTLAAPTTYSVPGFPGQSRTLADLYYNKYRDYDTSTGRYIQADPIGLAGGTSPYSYAMNSPLRYTDPTGEVVPLVLCGVGALAGGAGTAVGEFLSGGGFDWKHVAIGAGAGCVAGVAAPFAATSALGAAALGAATNAAQYAAAQYIDGECLTAGGFALNAGLGAITGGLAGRFTPRGMEYSTDVLPWMQRGTQNLHSGLNRQRIVNEAWRGSTTGAASGAVTTAVGNPTLWQRVQNTWDRIFK